MAPGLAEGVGQPAAAADPGAVPTLAVEERHHRHDGQGGEEAPEDQAFAVVGEISGIEVVNLQRPHVAEVVLGLVKELEEDGQREGEGGLHHHDHARPDDLVAVVPVLEADPGSAEQDAERVE